MTDANQERAALAAIDAIIADFGAHRRDNYFAGFSPDATFLFHSAPARLESRAEYEALWKSWEDHDGFQVESCSSHGRRIQLFGDTAVFSHEVETVARFGDAPSTTRERESIIMRLIDGDWVCVHEHLSVPSNPTHSAN